MQVKFLPVDVFTQFKRDNNQTIKEQYLKLNSSFVKLDQEVKHINSQFQQLQQQITSLQATVNKQVQEMKKMIEKNQQANQQQQVQQQVQQQQAQQQQPQQQQTQQQTQYKLFTSSYPQLPTSSSSFQKVLDEQKGDLNVPENCQIIYQPIGQNLQLSQTDQNSIYEYQCFSDEVDVCNNYVIFKNTKPQIIYIKTISIKTLEVKVKPILIIFYEKSIEVLPQKYLGKTWLRYNNLKFDVNDDDNGDCISIDGKCIGIDDILNMNTTRYSLSQQDSLINTSIIDTSIIDELTEEQLLQVLEITTSHSLNSRQIDELKKIFPNVRIITQGFVSYYVGCNCSETDM